MLSALDMIYASLADCDPSVRRGMVYCLTCGKSQKVNAAECFKRGWPECCGRTMSLQSPEERGDG